MKRLVPVLAAIAVAMALMPPQTARAEILAMRVDPPWVADGDPEYPYGTLPTKDPLGSTDLSIGRSPQRVSVPDVAQHDSRAWQTSWLYRFRLIWRFAWVLR
jgi:hypothetical protein